MPIKMIDFLLVSYPCMVNLIYPIILSKKNVLIRCKSVSKK